MSDQNEGFHKVLVLNATHAPINITSWRRAMTLVFKGKACGIEFNGIKINGKIPLPEIIKLSHYIPMPYSEVVLSRKNIYLRDDHTCQYCGKKGGELTIDHIIPKSKGGSDGWDNVVVCCARCNNRKADRNLEEAGMKLKKDPYRPPSALYLYMTRLSNIPQSWYNYFFGKN